MHAFHPIEATDITDRQHMAAASSEPPGAWALCVCVDATLAGFAVTATVVTASAINVITNRATIFRLTLFIST